MIGLQSDVGWQCHVGKEIRVPADLDRGSEELIQALDRMSGILFSEETLQSALDLTCALAKETIPGTAGAGVTLLRKGKHMSVAFTDPELVFTADELQYKMQEGPCLSAMQDKKVYRIDDASSETRWPRWISEALALGIQSCVSSPLLLRNAPIGAVKVYSKAKNQFDDRDEYILAMFAEHAAVVLSNARDHHDVKTRTSDLKKALETRDLIGMAIGMLMERNNISEEAAFDILRSESQKNQVKLRDVARRVVERSPGAERD